MLRVVLIGLLTAVLYLLVYFIQGAIFSNGLTMQVMGALVQVNPGDGFRLLFQIIVYYGATVGLFVLYIWVLVLCRRGRLQNLRVRNLALLFPIVFNVGLLTGRPHLSIDVFSYLAHGYLGKLPDTNPYVQAASEVGESSFGQQLIDLGWLAVHPPSPYGPVWTWVEILVVTITENIPAGMWLIKGLVVTASLGCAALIWIILGRIRSEDQLFGTLLYLWNPMIVVEFAAEGHNDALMIFFVLAALGSVVYVRPAASIVAMMLGVLTKYLPLIFLPTQLLYLWRTRQHGRAFALHLLFGSAFSLGLAVLLYGPLWAGLETFQAVRVSGQPFVAYSPRGVLFAFLLFFTSDPEETARLTTLITGSVFVVYVLVVSWRVHDAVSLLKACSGIALIYLLVASPDYWPWYATLPLALIALAPRGILVWMALVLTFCSRLVAPLSDIAVNGFMPSPVMVRIMTGLGLTLPLFILLLFASWRLLCRDKTSGQKGTGIHTS